ncbi:AAA family ATPase [Ohessyouella blattaphilus]|uniref:AAA family ATPase n=1 Tax=Ohessyouella blattaphilus TaxID=2949333 RepID=UPI003EBDB93C
MQRSKYLPGFPLPPGFVKRNRLHEILTESIENRVITVVAGPGYGKTTLVSTYVQKSKAKIVWLDLSPLDNQIEFFWKSLGRVAMREVPELGEIILNHSFPGSIQELSAFLIRIAEDEKIKMGPGRILLVLDNFEVLKNQQILDFLNYIQSTNQSYSNFEVQHIIISNEPITNISIHPLHLLHESTHKYRSIRAGDLAFTQEEVQQLFNLYGSTLKEEQLNQIMEETEGWPLVVHALAAVDKESRGGYESIYQNVYGLLQANFFANYPKSIQDILIKLSGFQTFNLEIISRLLPPQLAQEPAEVIQLIFQNPFIEYTLTKRRLRFIRPYQRFLLSKFLTLGTEEQKETLDILGEYLFENTDMYSVIELYIRSNNYEGITQCLKLLSPYNLGLPYTKIIIRYLRHLPREFREKDPWISFFTL